jgi:hypothetical protein
MRRRASLSAMYVASMTWPETDATRQRNSTLYSEPLLLENVSFFTTA